MNERINQAPLWETRMLRKIRNIGGLFFIFFPIIVSVGLEFLSAFVDNDLAVYHPSAALTVFSWILVYAGTIFTFLYQYGGYGVLGYSIMRFGCKKSRLLIIFSGLSVIIQYIGIVGCAFYSYGHSAVSAYSGYLVPLWGINFFLSLFSAGCVSFLCALLRASFHRRGRMEVSCRKEKGRKNALRRLYLWIVGLLFFFALVPDLITTYSEIRSVGAPETVWDAVTLLLPYGMLILFSVLGFFEQVCIGNWLSRLDQGMRSAEEDKKRLDADTKKQRDIIGSF